MMTPDYGTFLCLCRMKEFVPTSNSFNMDEKLAIQSNASGRTVSQGMLHHRTLKRFLLAVILSASFCSIFLLKLPWIFSIPDIWPTNEVLPAQQVPITSADITKIPLEAHIMSKCPDARDCLRDLVVPAMEKIVDKVDFQLSFIGQYVSAQSIPPPDTLNSLS